MATIVATWKFSQPGVEAASAVLNETSNALDAVEVGIRAVEEDAEVTSVGYGGLPNSEGELQLDAALMTSAGQQGAVLALTGHRSAIGVARRILHGSRHPMLSGDGAVLFSVKHGSKLIPNEQLLTPHAAARFSEAFAEAAPQPPTPSLHAEEGMPHADTVGMLACGKDGMAAGCATSGMQFKHPGRIGDSPIFGAGLYADECGAAAATGDGDQMLRFCLSFLIVEQIRQGNSPTKACQYAIRRFHSASPDSQAAVIAINSCGQVGAAASHNGFSYVQWTAGEGIRVVAVAGESFTRWKHSCV